MVVEQSKKKTSKPAVTIVDVAALAGVSIKTVSRVVNLSLIHI